MYLCTINFEFVYKITNLYSLTQYVRENPKLFPSLVFNIILKNNIYTNFSKDARIIQKCILNSNNYI